MVQTLDNQIQQCLPLLRIEEYNNELEAAETEFEIGNFITHNEMIKQMKQW